MPVPEARKRHGACPAQIPQFPFRIRLRKKAQSCAYPSPPLVMLTVRKAAAVGPDLRVVILAGQLDRRHHARKKRLARRYWTLNTRRKLFGLSHTRELLSVVRAGSEFGGDSCLRVGDPHLSLRGIMRMQPDAYFLEARAPETWISAERNLGSFNAFPSCSPLTTCRLRSQTYVWVRHGEFHFRRRLGMPS